MFARLLSALADRSRSASTWNVLGLIGLAAACLSPTLMTGYIADDCILSLSPGMRVYARTGLGSWIVNEIRASMAGGRFYPIHWVTLYGIFATFTDVYFYKVYILVFVIVDVLLFVSLVKKLGGDGGLACLAGGLVVLAFQLRAFFDPILSFFGLLQLVVALALLSMLAMERYLDGRGKRWLAIGAAIYLACCLLYEVSYPFFVLHAWQVARRRPGWGAWLGKSLPFVVASGFCVILAILVRRNRVARPGGAEFYETNLSPSAIFSTMATQASSAFPLSYFSVDPSGLFWSVKSLRGISAWLCQADALGVVAAASIVCYLAIRRSVERGNGGGRVGLVGLGALLVILPGATIAITRKYQTMVTPGNGYVPVFIQYFGVSLLLATAIRSLLARIPRGSLSIAARAVVAVVVGLSTGVTYLANRATALSLVSPPGTVTYNLLSDAMAGSHHYHRRNLEAALDSGLMDEVPEHARVYLSNEYPGWYEGIFTAFFFAKQTSKEYVTIPPSAVDLASPKAEFLRKVLAHRQVLDGPGFLVRDVCTGPKSGYVVLSQKDGGAIRLFVRHPHLFSTSRSNPAFLVAGESPPDGPGIPYLKRARDLRLVKSGSDWALLSLAEDGGLVSSSTIRPILDPTEATQLAKVRDRSRALQASRDREGIIRR